MKRFLFLILLPVIVFATPSWLYNIEYNKKHDIVGYGISENLAEAKKNAIADIANTLHVSVDSSLDMIDNDENGKLTHKTSAYLKTSSKAVLSGVKYIRMEKSDGLWYVAAKYDNSSLDIKLKKLLPQNLKDEAQNRYLKNTPLIKKLNKEFNVKLNYKIIRKDNLWQLQYKDILLPINMQNFYQLFSNQSTSDISIKPNKDIYKESDDMYFYIKHKNPSYISVLYVEHNGKVGVLLANKKSEKSFTFPDIKNEDSFKIVNPYGKTIKELYVVLSSKKPLNLHKFENVSDSLLDESNYNFDKLLLKFNEYDFSTYEIKIRK
jgi:hypothetical protein